MPYLRDIWKSRFFWLHLALADLRSRWRRSYFGALWSVFQPLGMMALIGIVLGRLMNLSFAEYAPYVLSGIIFWEFISACAIGGSLAFVQNEPYIKQCRRPLAIYTLRTVIANLATLAIASIALISVVLPLRPETFGWAWLAWGLSLPIMLSIAWPLATALAYISVRFRDIPHALTLALQALWFVSPVYFEVKFFRSAGLDGLIDYNPVYHLLQTVRAPLLDGEWPSTLNYAVCLGTSAALTFIAWLIGRRLERKILFYL